MTNPAGTERAVLPGGAEVLHDPGARVTTDTLLLGLWADPPEGAVVCELGCGSAASSVVAALRAPGRFWLGVDVDSSRLRLARRNLAGPEGARAALLCCDVLRLPSVLHRECADMVMMNPPYHEAGRGRSSPCPSRELARRSGTLALPAFVRAAAHLLRPGGRLVCVCGARALTRLLLACRAHGLWPGRLQPVGPAGKPASLVLMEAFPESRDPALLPQAAGRELVSLLLKRGS